MIYEAAGRQSAGHGAGAESIYGKKSDYYAPRPIQQQSGTGSTSVPLSSCHLPPPPLPPSNNNKQQNQSQTQSPPQQQQQSRESNNKIYYAPRQQPPQNGRYQTAPQPIPGAPSSHYSINQKIYMSPTNPFLSSTTTLSPPQQQSQGIIYGERHQQPPPPSPRHAPPAVPQRSYLQQYHAQSQLMDHGCSPSHAPQQQQQPHYGQATTGGANNQIVPPQYLYQRPQPPGTKFVSSPIYNAAGMVGGDGRGGVPINVASSYHGGQSGNVVATSSPPSSSLSSSSHMISHNNPSKYTRPLVCSSACCVKGEGGRLRLADFS